MSYTAAALGGATFEILESWMREHGSFTLSLDLELAWGSWSTDRFSSEVFAGGSTYARKLNETCKDLSMPATWAVVGAVAGLNLADLQDLPTEASVSTLRPDLGPFAGAVPTIGHIVASPEAFVDPGLIRDIASAGVGHELACHTFFHALPATPDGMLADVEAVRRALPQPSEMDTIVFPRDALAHLDVLHDAGIRQYRAPGAAPYLSAGKPAGWGRVQHTLDQFLGRRAPIVEILPGRVVRVPSSAILTLRYGVRRRIPLRILRRRYLDPLDEAAATGGAYHLWTHPWNLALPGSDAFGLLEEVLVRAAELRDRGDLAILTIRDLARRSCRSVSS